MTRFNPEKIIVDGFPGTEEDGFSQYLRSLYSKLGRQECIEAVKQARAIAFDNNFHLAFVDHVFWLVLYRVNTDPSTKAKLEPLVESYMSWIIKQFRFKEEDHRRIVDSFSHLVDEVSGTTSL
jgi:hypothetical protein